MKLLRSTNARRLKRRTSGFNFTRRVGLLCEDMIRRVPALGHIDPDRVAMSFCQTRKAVRHGMYASLTPMRFAGGGRTMTRNREKWGVQRLCDDSGREMLYILSFYLPRFLDMGLHDKLTTVAHELWHISPRFDGDLRRFDGRCYAHGASQKKYDAQVERLVSDWLSRNPPSGVYDFLHHDFAGLARRYGRVHGTKIPTPKLFPVK